jgi:hypothetical protein
VTFNVASWYGAGPVKFQTNQPMLVQAAPHGVVLRQGVGPLDAYLSVPSEEVWRVLEALDKRVEKELAQADANEELGPSVQTLELEAWRNPASGAVARGSGERLAVYVYPKSEMGAVRLEAAAPEQAAQPQRYISVLTLAMRYTRGVYLGGRDCIQESGRTSLVLVSPLEAETYLVEGAPKYVGLYAHVFDVYSMLCAGWTAYSRRGLN